MMTLVMWDIFQSALPRGERHSSKKVLQFPCKFQSALPRGERLPDAGRVLNYRGISIRAPARGATLTHWSQLTSYKFQSALPRGERLLNGGSIDNPDFISIRAPARGATWILHDIAMRLLFQSALPRGERRWNNVKSYFTTEFQSALPRGERRVSPAHTVHL